MYSWGMTNALIVSFRGRILFVMVIRSMNSSLLLIVILSVVTFYICSYVYGWRLGTPYYMYTSKCVLCYSDVFYTSENKPVLILIIVGFCIRKIIVVHE